MKDRKPISTTELGKLLRDRYPRDRYAMVFDVPDSVGVSQSRRIDAVALGCWKSGGRQIEGFELKVSRGDWLRELKQVTKADPFVQLCDRFWLVTGDASIAKLDEIPAAWGWMAATANGLVIERPATRLPGCGDALPRQFVIGLMRRMQDDLVRNPDVAAYIDERVKLEIGHAESRVETATRTLRGRLEALESTVKKFETQSGIKLDDWRMGNVGKLVSSLMSLGYSEDGGLRRVQEVLQSQERVLESTLRQVKGVLGELGPDGPAA